MIVFYSPDIIKSQIADMDHAEGVDPTDLARSVISAIEETALAHGAKAVAGGYEIYRVEGNENEEPSSVSHLSEEISRAIDIAIENAGFTIMTD